MDSLTPFYRTVSFSSLVEWLFIISENSIKHKEIIIITEIFDSRNQNKLRVSKLYMLYIIQGAKEI